MTNILIVDDDQFHLNYVGKILKSSGYESILSESDSRNVMTLFDTESVDIVLLDNMMPFISGKKLLKMITDAHPNICVIMLTSSHEIEHVTECLELGAFDYLIKPIVKDQLCNVIQKAQSENTATFQNWETIDDEHSFITKDKKILNMMEYVQKVSKSTSPVLITGETGTGKEVMARLIHKKSGSNGAFVGVNIAGFDDTLFSDALFGHIKGAYTGAHDNRTGLIEQARRGTLFLDEIGDLPLASQVKLLRVLQDGEYFPLGADKPVQMDVRLVCATNKPLDDMMKTHDFREDLYYRICSHSIELPALRARKQDIEPLTDFFLSSLADQYGEQKPLISESLMRLLQEYDYPGNIRELKSILEDAFALRENNEISIKSIFPYFRNRNVPEPAITADATAIEEISRDKLIHLIKVYFGELPSLDKMEHFLIETAMDECNGHQSEAARLLGVARQTLYRKMK